MHHLQFLIMVRRRANLAQVQHRQSNKTKPNLLKCFNIIIKTQLKKILRDWSKNKAYSNSLLNRLLLMSNWHNRKAIKIKSYMLYRSRFYSWRRKRAKCIRSMKALWQNRRSKIIMQMKKTMRMHLNSNRFQSSCQKCQATPNFLIWLNQVPIYSHRRSF